VWEKPTVPARDAQADSTPSEPPPSYSGYGPPSTSEKANPNNPYNAPSDSLESDHALAARLQAEEDSRARGVGASADYYNSPIQPTTSPMESSYPQELPPRGADRKRGLVGKLFGKLGGPHQQAAPGYGQPPQHGYAPQYGYPPQQQGYLPQQQQQPYYGPAAAYAPQYQQAAPHKSGIGMGGLALGVGGGLLGGMLLEDAIQDHDQNEYQQGFDQGQSSQDGMGNNDYGDGGMGGSYDNDDFDGNF
jgi:hypothetical protein